jgi:hypothetical protein
VGCEKIAVGKVENRLFRAAVSYEKLCAVGEIFAIPLKILWNCLYAKYSYKSNMFTVLHVNIFFERKILNFLSFSSIWSR